MAYKGYMAEIPAGDGGANFDANPRRVPITDLIDADGVIVEDGLLRKEPGASVFGTGGITGAAYTAASLSAARQWGMVGVSLKGSSIAIVSASEMTSNAAVSAGPDFKVELTVPAGGISAGSCIIVSANLFTYRTDSTVTCEDDEGNTYTLVSQESTAPTVTRIFVALNVSALSSGQKITLKYDQESSGLSHVAIGNEFTGILTASAIDKEVANDGNSDMPYVYYGSLSSIPELLVAAGNIYETASTTVTAGFGFTKCGEATNGPGTTNNKAWQQYRIDSDYKTIIGVHDWRPTSTWQRVITATLEGKIYKETFGNLDAVTLVSALSTTARPGKFVEGGQEAAGNNRKLFYFNGVNAVQVLSGDASTMAAVSSPPADWTGSNQPVSGIIQRNRLAAWGNLNHPHQLYLSTVSSHEDFSTIAGSDVRLLFSCYPSIGDRLYSGAKHLGLLWLFKWPRGICWLDDSDPDTDNWSIQMHTDALGCAPTPYGALGIDNDILFLSADGNFHLLSAVQGGVVRDSNLSMVMRHAKWLRENINLSKLSQVISVWYPHKKWAIWGLPSTGSSVNDLVVLFDFSEVHQAGDLPRLFISNRDNIEALCLYLESDQIQRPMLGEGGVVWLLDRDARNKDGLGYLGRYKTARTDFKHVEQRLAARKKIFDRLRIVKTATTGTLTVKTEIDGTVNDTLSFDLSMPLEDQPITGEGYELALICENSVADVDFQIQRHFVFFREGEE